MFKFPQNTKFRVISGGVCFYTTAKQIRKGIGDFVNFNVAVLCAMGTMELEVDNGKITQPRGIAGTWNDIQVQLDVA